MRIGGRAANLAAALAGAACLAAAGAWNNRVCITGGTAPYAPALRNAGPLVVFSTMALGGFRSILIDILWLRAARMQDEGDYFALAQLADWITKLDPAMTTVWGFHAWNMAYNIGYMFEAPEDRWRWVQNAIRLLRDEGLAHNPRDPEMYRELGWLFQHKIGEPYDTAHIYFKSRLALEMQTLLGGAAPDYGAADAAGLAEKLRGKMGMSLEAMKQIDAVYGPLDWRLPEAHALYWAWLGMQQATNVSAAFTCERMVCQALANMFRKGRLKFEPQSDVYVATPDLKMLPKAMAAFEQLVERHESSVMARAAHASFLGEAVFTLFCFNRRQQAREVFELMRARYPGAELDAGFEHYVYALLVRSIRQASYKSVSGLIEGFLYNAYLWAAFGETEAAAGFNAVAQLLWTEYMKEIDRPYLAATTGLPPMAEMRRRALERALADAATPEAQAILRLYAEKAESSADAQPNEK